jgi:hypothetical protein
VGHVSASRSRHRDPRDRRAPVQVEQQVLQEEIVQFVVQLLPELIEFV